MADTDSSETATPRRRGIPIILFVLYLVLLAWVVLWKLEVPYIGAAAGLARPLKLVPFVASGDAGASAPPEVVANIALFVPFGLYLGILKPSMRWWTALAIFVAASLTFEITQHLLSTGSFDTTDVITNSAGGAIGFGVLILLRRRLGTRTSPVMTRVVLIGTVLSLVAIGAFLAIPLHYGPQRDVVVTRPGPTG